MKIREDAMVSLYNRIKAERTSLGLASCKRTPTKSLQDYKLPACFLLEGVDIITTSSARTPDGYPSLRECEVTCEIVCVKSTSIFELYRALRKVILSSHILVVGATIKEIRAEGPTSYGLPDIHGMRLVLKLSYTDTGI